MIKPRNDKKTKKNVDIGCPKKRAFVPQHLLLGHLTTYDTQTNSDEVHPSVQHLQQLQKYPYPLY